METQAVGAFTVNSDIAALVSSGAARVQEIMRQNEAAAEAHAAQERARIADAWQPILEKLKAAWPAWVTPYLQTPNNMPTTCRHGDTEYRPLVLSLPSLAPIRVYVDGNIIGYSVPRATLALDEYGDEGWQARYGWSDWSATRWQIQSMTSELAVACYQAVAPAEEYAAFTAEAEQRNREATVRPAPPEAELEPAEPTALVEASRTMARAERMDGEHAAPQVAPALQWVTAYAAIAQAEALTRLAEVAETLLEAGQVDRAARIWGS